MNRSHVIRLNPTPEQEVYFRKACGVARHSYNWALARWKAYRAEGTWAKIKDLKAEYNKIKGEQFPWAYEVTKCAPEQEFSHLGQAFANYWRMKQERTLPKLKHPRKDGEEGGFPRFKNKTLVTCSDGEQFENQRHYRVACQREDTLHQMTTHVVHTYALIGLENLHTKGMLANHCLAQAVSDASFFEVKRQLLYKAEQYGGYVQLVDRWYASSKTCSACGWVDEDLSLADRTFVCEECGLINARDLNAAINIRKEALRLRTDVPVVASSGHKFARREREALALSAESVNRISR